MATLVEVYRPTDTNLDYCSLPSPLPDAGVFSSLAVAVIELGFSPMLRLEFLIEKNDVGKAPLLWNSSLDATSMQAKHSSSEE